MSGQSFNEGGTYPSSRLYLRYGREIPDVLINQSAGGVTFEVRIHPRAKRNAITGQIGNALKVSLTAPPIDGRANEACIEFFAKLLKVPRTSVTIASGHASRNKVIRIAGLCAAELHERLGRNVTEFSGRQHKQEPL